MNHDLLQYFKSPAAMAEFALLHTDGETRQRLLGVTRAHYSDKALADEWLKRLIPVAASLSMEACIGASRMYDEMLAR